jgi:hypothetical protein
MTDDPFRAGFARFSRSMMLPWRFLPRQPSEASFDALRRGNAALDVLFYDVGVVGEDEADALATAGAGEGTILIVPPSGAGRLSICRTIAEYFDQDGGEISTLTVAGVGSSALGTAAFARNVADAVGKPVAAVVSGHGLGDLVGEATADFPWFAGLGTLHDLWSRFDRSFDWLRSAASDPLAGGTDPMVAERDADVVLALLRDDRAHFELIVAHSKGNMVVGDALHALQREDRVRSDRIGESVHIVSISSRRSMPRSCRQVTEIVGRWDLIGDFATRRDAPADVVVPDAWHHTNTDLLGHLPVTRVLKEVLGTGA